MTRIACIGECMIELREEADGRLSRGYGGDTLNTAVYLSRLGDSVNYVTALGDDPWSDEMIAGWRAEGIGTELAVRLPGRLPGLYVIQTDASGERRFSYWRDSAAARSLFELPETPAICEALADYDLLYFSGVTLSLYRETGQQRLFETLDRVRQKGGRVAFDTNFRPRGWPDRLTAQTAYESAFERAEIVLASTEDLDLLFDSEGQGKLLSLGSSAEIVLKLPDLACRVVSRDMDLVVRADPVARVVDTTAAGDSFAAAYLASRLAGADPAIAAAAGHRLAGAVVGYSGAVIPREGTPAMTGEGLAFEGN
ncbi:sugar kinase [Microvirga aerophila]|uniref:2-dehydro-3-deoxygluconokinase n=1 Tax=Microvirga aerophila TaxID=670291 RepID=A0A512C0J0_9HYPH|nr:sugar kinase [Microvirga aerophila]GEO17731.1 2-dehydro-3-deoxygluconokinase [Microvirga aerophila]